MGPSNSRDTKMHGATSSRTDDKKMEDNKRTTTTGSRSAEKSSDKDAKHASKKH